MVYVTRHVEFEMAHLLADYNGKCKNLHGHTYKLEATVCSLGRESNDFGFALDFKTLDRLLNEIVPDHKFVANSHALKEDRLDPQASRGPECGIIEVLKAYGLEFELYPFPTSAENMVGLFASKLQAALNQIDPELVVTMMSLWETTDSHATWVRDAQ